VLLAGGAVFASLTFLDFFVPAWLVAAWKSRSSRPRTADPRPARPRALSGILVAGAGVLAYAALAAWRLRARGQLYYGGTRGFWFDTVDSLIRCALYLRPYPSFVVTALWLLVPLAVAGAVWLAAKDALSRRAREEQTRGTLEVSLFILFAGCLLGVAAHAFLGTPFRINRTAAWIVPVFAVTVATLLDRGLSVGAGFLRALAASGCVVVAAAGAAHFAACANTRYAILQLHDADTKAVIRDLERLRDERRLEGNLLAYASWELRPSLDYYRLRRNLGWLGVTEDAPRADLAFLSPREASLSSGMRIERTYPLTGNALLLREGR